MIDYIHALVELRSEHAPWSYIVDVIGVMITIAVFQLLMKWWAK